MVVSSNSSNYINVVNKFICSTINIINNMDSVLEKKFSELETKMTDTEVLTELLEIKLNSTGISFDNFSSETNKISIPPPVTENPSPNTADIPPEEPKEEQSDSMEPSAEEKPDPTLEDDTELQKYVRMINMGVPLLALIPKLKSDGIDPDRLKAYIDRNKK